MGEVSWNKCSLIPIGSPCYGGGEPRNEVDTGDSGLVCSLSLRAAICWCAVSHWRTHSGSVFNPHGEWHIPRQHGNGTE